MTVKKIFASLILLLTLASCSGAIPLTKDNTDKSKLPKLYHIKNPKRPANNPNAQRGGSTIIGGGRDPRILAPSLVVLSDLMQLAQKILTYNSSAFETTQTIKNFQGFPGYTGEIKRKVCAKNKTIAAGVGDIKVNGKPYMPGESVQYFPFVIITADPEYKFSGQIRVGLKMSAVKDFLISELDDNSLQVQDAPGRLSFRNETMSLDFLYENDIITQISYYQPVGFQNVNIKSAVNFIKAKAREMNLNYLYL